MRKIVWHKGPPPHIGWWLANTLQSNRLWRWWNGEFWSSCADERLSASEAIKEAELGVKFGLDRMIEWSYYWPKNARVPRIDPRKKK